jgi:hypothetical protein
MIRVQEAGDSGRVCPGRRVVVCDACGGDISGTANMRILRSNDAVPEDPTVYEVHVECTERFIGRNSSGKWQILSRESGAASWFLPTVIRVPERRLRLPARSAATSAPPRS